MKKSSLAINIGGSILFISLLVFLLRKRKATPPVIKYAVVEGGRLTSRYLAERKKREGIHIHKGIDIGAPSGTPIRAVSDGTVFLLWKNGEVRGYGNTVVIKNADGTASLYAHLLGWITSLKVGQPVLQGQVIGYVGNTESGTLGKPMQPHLHLEIHSRATASINKDNPDRLDPEVYLDSIGMAIG